MTFLLAAICRRESVHDSAATTNPNRSDREAVAAEVTQEKHIRGGSGSSALDSLARYRRRCDIRPATCPPGACGWELFKQTFVFQGADAEFHILNPNLSISEKNRPGNDVWGNRRQIVQSVSLLKALA